MEWMAMKMGKKIHLLFVMIWTKMMITAAIHFGNENIFEK